MVNSAKHVLIFLIVVFAGLFAAVFVKNSHDPSRDTRPVLKIYGSSSLISQWGPGPILRDLFEKSCDCRVEFFESPDATMIFQKLKSDSKKGADLVFGFDQFDLEMIQQGFDWKRPDVTGVDFTKEIKSSLATSNLVPYDWSLLTFIFRKSATSILPTSLDELLREDLKGQIALEDPRTSSPGLQFLLWLINAKGEEDAFQFLKKLNPQLQSYSPSWSSAYGFFQKGQAKTAFSYVTSPIYHQVEENSTDFVAASFSEGHPKQIEFMGIPGSCQNCELAQKFITLVLSKEGQKVIMEKNIMFPVIAGVREGTPFEKTANLKVLENNSVPSVLERERLLKKWSQVRRGE